MHTNFQRSMLINDRVKQFKMIVEKNILGASPFIKQSCQQNNLEFLHNDEILKK